MRLFQNDLIDDPFWMLVACKLVNLTTWNAVQPNDGKLQAYMDWLKDASSLGAAA